MEKLPKGLTPPGLDRSYVTRFAGLIGNLLDIGKQPVFHESTDWKGGENDILIGFEHVIPEEQLDTDERIKVTSYQKKAGRTLMRQMVQEQTGVDEQPLWHAEIIKQRFSYVGFSATVYGLESGDMLVWAHWDLREDEIFSEESRACYEFARQAGLGATWVEAMYACGSSKEPLNSGEVIQYFDSSQAEAFLSFLNGRMNGV